jgi:hypothetical protein
VDDGRNVGELEVGVEADGDIVGRECVCDGLAVTGDEDPWMTDVDVGWAVVGAFEDSAEGGVVGPMVGDFVGPIVGGSVGTIDDTGIFGYADEQKSGATSS